MAAGGGTMKSESAKKSEFMKELQRLKIQEQNHEKEKQTHLYAKHGHLYKEMADIHAEEMKIIAQRNAEKQKLKQQLGKIKNMVRKFHREMKDVKPTPEFVEKLKVIMEDIEEQISNFKEQQREQYDELIRDERIATQEVSVMNNKFDSWATLGPPKLDDRDKKPGKVASHRDITKDLPPEVAAFERFVAQHGGVRGGWDEFHHGTFLKYRNRHKGKPSFIREVVAFLPGLSEEEIRHHELWYQQYLDLNEEKKEAIQKWKEKKEIEKETLMKQAGLSDSDDEETVRRKERLQQIAEEERRERLAELNKWKVEKEIERAEKEAQKLKEELEKAQREEKERQLREEQKAKVEAFRRNREEEKEHREYMKQMEAQIEYEKRVAATQEVHKYQERDLSKVKKKMAKTQAHKEAEKERQNRIQTKLKAQNESHIKRDPSRLLQPTQGWKERQKDTTRSAGQVFHVQHRAVPTWRQT